MSEEAEIYAPINARVAAQAVNPAIEVLRIVDAHPGRPHVIGTINCRPLAAVASEDEYGGIVLTRRGFAKAERNNATRRANGRMVGDNIEGFAAIG